MAKGNKNKKDPVAFEPGARKSKIIPFNPARTKPAQEILDLFQIVFKAQLESPNLPADIQDIKKDLYDRKYLEAFANSERNKSYMTRWSSSRSLAYASILAFFDEIYELITKDFTISDDESDSEDENEKSEEYGDTCRCLSVGAGAAGEFIGLAAVFTRMMESKAGISNKKLNVDIVDISNWEEGLNDVYNHILEYWLSNSSNDAEQPNQPPLTYNFVKKDILQLSSEELQLAKQDLVTLLFTTNELFSENRSQSVSFLKTLNNGCRKGCYLLIVESAGSFSHIQVGTKMFPVQFLVDTVLCGPPGHEKEGAWEIVDSDDSCWFRLEKNLDYPLKLENMRFFYRLYRKKA